MSRVAEALARAGAQRAPAATPRLEPADLFPAELPPADGGFPPDRDGRTDPPEPAAVPPPPPRRQAPPRPADGGWAGLPPIRYRTAFREDLIEKLTVENGAASAVLEEFRKLAATLHHAQGVHQLKVIMVTSAAGGEGKSLTTVNLALTLSKSYRRRVLLVDADLRKPMLHDIFQVQNTTGLLNFLKAGSEPGVPGIEVSSRLVLMPSGGVSADPVGLLTSEAMAALLQQGAASFDWVLVDTPPAALLPDCNLLAPSVDGVLLVVDAFNTPHPLALRAIDAVGRERILGVVLNHAEHSASDYKAGQYGY